MDNYIAHLEGQSPLLMHRDNLSFSEAIKRWQTDPANKELSKAGDDRSPAWTWIGSLYHDNGLVGLDSDNLMTALREGGAKVKTGKKSETFKRQTQSGLLVADICSPLMVNGQTIPWGPIEALIGETDFDKHLDTAHKLGFDLLVKRARIGAAKHVRVRPMFAAWSADVRITVIDAEVSGLTKEVLQRILDCAGSLCGLCDWRPSSRTPGSFGRFTAKLSKA